MKLQKEVQEALSKQMNKEFDSAYLYLSMAAYLESTNFDGMARWMKAQAHEETQHGMKIFSYILQRGGIPTLDAIAKPKANWNGPQQVFEDALSHEELVSASIEELSKKTSKDLMTSVFLHWFITEQVEEESSVTRIVEKLKAIKGAPGGLFMLDGELGRRT